MSGSRALSRALYAAAAVPPLVALAVILWWHVDVPFWDEYDVPGQLLDHWLAGELELAELFVQDNEARKFVPKLISLGLVAMLGGWHVLPELLVTWSLALGIVLGINAILWREAVRTPSGRALALLTCTTLLFSLASWEHWLWGISVEAYLAPFFLVCSVFALDRRGPSIGAWAIAALCCFGGTYAHATGMVLWPLVGCGGLVMGSATLQVRGAERRRMLAGVAFFALVGAASIGRYFWDYHTPDHHQGFGAGLASPGVVYLFFARWVSSPLTLALALSNSTAEIVGTGALVVGFMVVAWALREARRRGAWRNTAFVLGLCLCGYSVASGVAAAMGRSEMGADAWRAPRYICYGLYLYAGVLVLLPWIAHRLPQPAAGRRRVVTVLQAVLVAVITINSVSAVRYLEITRGRLLRGHTALQLWLTGLPGHELDLLAPDFENRHGARVHRLIEGGIFAVEGLDPALFTFDPGSPVSAPMVEMQTTVMRSHGAVELEIRGAEEPGPGDAVVLTGTLADGSLAFVDWAFLEATASSESVARIFLDPAATATRLEDALLWHYRGRDGTVTPLGDPRALCVNCEVPVE